MPPATSASENRPDPRRVRALAFRLARMYLEVERGLRPPDQLEPYLTEAAYRRQRILTHRPAMAGAPTARDLGRVHVDMPRPDEITATIPARGTPERWGALVLHLVNRGGQWKVDQLERITPRTVARLRPEPHEAERDNVDTRIRRVEAERATVDAAHHAVRTRLDDPDMDGRTRAGRRLKGQLDRWSRRRDELDDELGRLRRRRDMVRTTPGGEEWTDPPRTRLTDDQIVAVLGLPPDQPKVRRLWHTTVDNVHAYRELWGVTDPSSLLGPPAANEAQQRHRDHVASLLRSVALRKSLSRRTERTTEPGHDLDIALER